MSKLFDTFTESGKLLQEGYDKLIAVNYDPNCEMVDVINEYDDLPELENSLDSLISAKNKIDNEVDELEREVSTRLAELRDKIVNAEITEEQL